IENGCTKLPLLFRSEDKPHCMQTKLEPNNLPSERDDLLHKKHPCGSLLFWHSIRKIQLPT
ncbi:hypothetical protein AB4Z22_37075, partial [Paenibacillus sp. TAF58]